MVRIPSVHLELVGSVSDICATIQLIRLIHISRGVNPIGVQCLELRGLLFLQGLIWKLAKNSRTKLDYPP